MKGKDGGPAFPSEQGECADATWNQTYHPGMSLRDWFAATIDIPIAVVLDGLDKNIGPSTTYTVGEVATYRAKLRYCEADAMLQVRQLPVTNTEAS